MKSLVVVVMMAMFLVIGCMNMPTKPSQISASYTSEMVYKDHDCDELAVELNHLARRENQLIIAQEQRIKTSEMQAFWYGYGQGDGIEASELANVKGQKESVRRAMELKNCQLNAKKE